MQVLVGLASGIGNGIFALPCLQALRNAGHRLTLWVEGDYPDLPALWRRCVYAESVIDGRQPGAVVPPADLYISGHWCPRALKNIPGLRWYRWTDEPNYSQSEWSLFAQAARDLGCDVPESPDVSAWCGHVSHKTKYDVGIIQGSKPGVVWARKRYAGMDEVARLLTAAGCSVAWFGSADDGQPPLSVDDRRGLHRLSELPEALKACRVIVGTDSGITHLASSLGIPTVFVFTATSSIKGEPVGTNWQILETHLPCQPCQATTRWAACTDWQCQKIDPADVVEAVEEWLPAKDDRVFGQIQFPR